MAILQYQAGQAGLAGVFPSISYISTDDTIAEVTTAGYLNHLQAEGASLPRGAIALVATIASAGAPPVSNFYHISYSSGNWSLSAI